VIAITAQQPRLGCDLTITRVEMCSVSDDLTDVTAQLEQLVRVIMHESEPQRFDELGAAIWRVLEARENLTKAASRVAKADQAAIARPAS